MENEAFEVALEAAGALERLGVEFHLGGSLASSIHGVPRATLDADFVAALQTGQGRRLCDELGKGFYADPLAIESAIVRKGSFNVIHLSTMFKVDVFVAGESPFSRTSFARSVPQPIGPAGSCLRVATPEDTVLHKLLWYRKGDQVSSRQWMDLVGVLEVQQEGLDLEYLRRWASELELLVLLEKAMTEARQGRG